jgi:hypothetical protein
MRLATYLTEVLKLVVAKLIQPNIYVIDPGNITKLSLIRVNPTAKTFNLMVGTEVLSVNMLDVDVAAVTELRNLGIPILKVSGKTGAGEHLIRYCFASNAAEEGLTIEEVASAHIRETYGLTTELSYEEVK